MASVTRHSTEFAPWRTVGGRFSPRILGLAELADVDDAALVGADADRPVSLGDLDVEVELAAVHDLAQDGADTARCARRGSGDVLDADLEAHRRAPLREIRVGEDR